MMARHFIDTSHAGLGKSRRIAGHNRLIVEERVRLQQAAWERQWQRVRPQVDKLGRPIWDWRDKKK